MENPKDKFQRLLESVEWSLEEKQWVLEYLENSGDDVLQQLMQKLFEAGIKTSEQPSPVISGQMLTAIHTRIGVVAPKRKGAIVKMVAIAIAAACVLGFLALFVVSTGRSNQKIETATRHAPVLPKEAVVQPGGNKAILTLADGSQIILDDQQNGTVVKQGSSKVIKLSGKIVYNASGPNTSEIVYNTITTPAGGQYQVGLADGSTVWLNASSSLYFPTAFAGKERRVVVKGEAFFEVTRNAAMPFKVKVNDAEIQVLGTQFNVMAYDDEATQKTTLLKGEIKFSKGRSSQVLKPGQQTQVAKNGYVSTLGGIDVEEVVAWKNGMFDFEGADIKAVARQLSRWYDVDLVFDKGIEDVFYAQIPRDTRLQDVLKALELTGKVKFVVEGRKIFARPAN